MSVTLIQQRIADDINKGLLPEETDARHLAEYVVTVQQGMAQQARDGADRSS
nr:hypothetical protein [Flexivirga meconopsidis]